MAEGHTNNFKTDYIKYFCNINVDVLSTESNAPQRLIAKWENFVSAVLNKNGIKDHFVYFIGIINFPAYNGANNFGTYFAWGIVNPANTYGTVYLTQYNSGASFVVKYNSDPSYSTIATS